MAWWYARLLFHGDRLIDTGIGDPLDSFGDVEVDGETESAEGELLTSVMVSGYALYGQLRGYYAIGVGHVRVDPVGGRTLATPDGLRHTEPVASLTPAQRRQIAAWLEDQSPDAWSSSLGVFRRRLTGPDDAGSDDRHANADSNGGETAHVDAPASGPSAQVSVP